MANFALSVPDADVLRVCNAIGDCLNLGRPATPAEIKGFIADTLKNIVLGYEQRQQAQQLQAMVFAPPPVNPIAIS